MAYNSTGISFPGSFISDSAHISRSRWVTFLISMTDAGFWPEKVKWNREKFSLSMSTAIIYTIQVWEPRFLVTWRDPGAGRRNIQCMHASSWTYFQKNISKPVDIWCIPYFSTTIFQYKLKRIFCLQWKNSSFPTGSSHLTENLQFQAGRYILPYMDKNTQKKQES